MKDIIKSLGGDRLGSENKMNIAMHNYHRSTHNLSTQRKTTMAPGVLYPIYSNVMMNGDVFDIDINAQIKTFPTKAPLFGSFKLQVDTFLVPIRLYQGILHNNPINIGMQMNKILLPKAKIRCSGEGDIRQYTDGKLSGIAPTSLLKYLGLSGIGVQIDSYNPSTGKLHYSSTRKINAVPIIAYYDIFKNYYANKQEDYAYFFGTDVESTQKLYELSNMKCDDPNNFGTFINMTSTGSGYWTEPYNVPTGEPQLRATIKGDFKSINGSLPTSIRVYVTHKGVEYFLGDFLGEGQDVPDNLITAKQFTGNSFQFTTQFTQSKLYNALSYQGFPADATAIRIYVKSVITNTGSGKPALVTFPLKNIDTMRETLLSKTQIGEEFVIDQNTIQPYGSISNPSSRTGSNANEALGNGSAMYGLCIKTYQSDIFNNWLKNELVEGTNGIAEITAVDTSSGSFTIDSLNLAQKVYNMLNRIAASGGTYEDWQEVVYTSNVNKRAETPIYCGGMSSEIVFEEIVSSAASGESPLGTLGGKGNQVSRKGGHVIIKADEPCYVMIIASLTPRIDYSQGNQFDLTEINSIDDLHKPALDGIGYEDLIGERMCWADTIINPDGTLIRSKVGKSVAWINYMTDVNKVYGEFSAGEGQSYMVLNRNYSLKGNNKNVKVADFTTYINPRKFNYAFAYADLDAQNFWGAFDLNIKARRVMSAKQIPNL